MTSEGDSDRLGFMYYVYHNTHILVKRKMKKMMRKSSRTPDLTRYFSFRARNYLGDYLHLMAIGNDFYGVFSANNTPDPANFPNGVVFQRNHSTATKTLFDVDGVTHVDVSIDPFFFKVSP